MVRFVDAHIHLSDPEFQPTISCLLSSIRFLDTLVVSVSMDMESSDQTLRLHDLLPSNIVPFIGIHPWSAQSTDLERFNRFANSSSNRVRGIGEIGLDRQYASRPEEHRAQRTVFEAMLDFAETKGLPVSVHSRGSYDDVLEILGSYHPSGVVLHWFGGQEKHLRAAVDRGYWLSYGPTTVYSKKTRRLARETPMELILTETDGPVRYGACFQHRMAVPSFIPSIVLALAETKKMGFDDVKTRLELNVSRYLGLKPGKR